jgi:hypothetical protein
VSISFLLSIFLTVDKNTAQAFFTLALLETDSSKLTWRKLKVIKRHSVNKMP